MAKNITLSPPRDLALSQFPPSRVKSVIFHIRVVTIECVKMGKELRLAPAL